MGGRSLTLSKVIECDDIPNDKLEIPTPDLAMAHKHLTDIAPFIPDLDETAEILLLIDRDTTEAHHVTDQRIGPPSAPFAQKLYLGWTIIGEVCLGRCHKPEKITVNKSHMLSNGQSSICTPCDAQLCVKNACSVFGTTDADEKIGYSTDDREFLELMNWEFHQDSNGKWTAPLPFHANRPVPPNNRSQALRRATTLDRSLKKNPTKCCYAIKFMQDIFQKEHAELAPP